MTESQFSTPILLILFNRPNITKTTFEEIRKLKPQKLFIAADGPREGNQEDIQKCIEAKKIATKIDWPCEIKTLFHPTNLGCGIAPSTAINWFFDNVTEGIILEDDCLPSQSFFYFCEKLLEFYRDDSRIFHIGGTIYSYRPPNHMKSSYYFHRIPRVGAWATWRRAWQKYDFAMKTFPRFKSNHIIKNIFDEELFQQAWLNIFQINFDKAKHTNKQTAWDFQWTYTVLSQNGLSISPTKNLVSNIGFGENATHTKVFNPFLGNIETYEIDTENLVHPEFVTPNSDDERWTMKHVFQVDIPNGLLWETKKLLKNKFPSLTKFYSSTKRKLSNT